VALDLQAYQGMLEIARPETRTAVHSQPQRVAWGIVDAILTLTMLPFAIWVGIVDGMVWAIANLPAALRGRPRIRPSQGTSGESP
jgi:hypothetical protein